MILVVLFIIFASYPVSAEVRLRFSTPAPPMEILVKSMNLFKEKLEASAPGEFDVSIHPGGSLFKQGTEIPAMQRGNLEMNTLATFEVAQFVSELSVYNAGYLFRDFDHLRKVWFGPLGQDYAKKVEEKMGVKILYPCYLGTRQVSIREIRNANTPKGLDGLKLRMPGSPDFLLLGKGLGVNATPMAMSDVYLAMKTGSIDGQDNPVSITRAAKLDEVTKEVILTRHMVQMIFYAASKKFWEALTEDQQKKIMDATIAACEWNDKTRLEDESVQINYFKSKGIQITEPDVQAYKDYMWQVYKQEGKLKEWDMNVINQIRDVK
jgi:tripartite ATP-independent transporter DctP family solute receptor